MAISSSDQQLIDTYLDAAWMEKGLGQNTLDAYRRDLHTFGVWLASISQTLVGACGSDVQRYLAHRFEEGLAARSTARQLSCLRGFYRYLLRENCIQGRLCWRHLIQIHP